MVSAVRRQTVVLFASTTWKRNEGRRYHAVGRGSTRTPADTSQIPTKDWNHG